jgi:hypothetical protein
MRTRIIVVVAAAALAAVLLVAGAMADGKSKAKSSAKPNLEKRVLFSVLTGRKEVTDSGRRGAGDPDGRGSFTALVKGDQLCFGITVKNVDQPVAAHIHKARPNRNGPIVVPLTQPSTGDPGASSGCVTVDPALAKAILKNPHRYYANVHTAAFPGGAVRGQLFGRSR